MLDKLALLLTIIGGINWGSIGIFQYDLAALWCISLFFRDTPVTRED